MFVLFDFLLVSYGEMLLERVHYTVHLVGS